MLKKTVIRAVSPARYWFLVLLKTAVIVLTRHLSATIHSTELIETG